MICKVINQWLNIKINEFNDALNDPDKLKYSDINIDSGFIPANQRDKTYSVKLRNISEDNSETLKYTVGVSVEFHFSLFKRPAGYYTAIIDNYLFELASILGSVSESGLEYFSDGITLANIRGLALNKLDRLDRGGKYLLPVLEFELEAVPG